VRHQRRCCCCCAQDVWIASHLWDIGGASHRLQGIGDESHLQDTRDSSMLCRSYQRLGKVFQTLQVLQSRQQRAADKDAAAAANTAVDKHRAPDTAVSATAMDLAAFGAAAMAA